MLIFYYGVVGAAKSANALITKFDYEETGFKVWLISTCSDEVTSKTGLSAKATHITPEDDIYRIYKADKEYTHRVIIVDEAQNLTTAQVDQLRKISNSQYCANCFCYGLRTDGHIKLFEGSKRLFEIADKVKEIPANCYCGNKALYNVLISTTGNILTSPVNSNNKSKFITLCDKCYRGRIRTQKYGLDQFD